MTARIVILNGAGSAGKSSIAKALQEITATPFLHFSMDRFCEMLPSAYWNHPDGFRFVGGTEAGKPSIAIETGPVGLRLMDGMRHAIAAVADCGNDLIVDDVLLGDEQGEYRRLLAPYTVHWVGVHCSLAVMEAREAARGDRLIGLARWQFPRVRAGRNYDLEIHTDDLPPLDCARLIRDRFGL
ncbi:chloramphenicol phosphotransferase CPT family protein [Dongia sp.]|uniref:chloramphenicol phosphotransferase CPT family protein n=1 Tax=Dongia sp. TaxID=1977262 RepID=UPI0035B41094